MCLEGVRWLVTPNISTQNPQIFHFPENTIFILLKSKFLEVSELSMSKEIKLSDTSHVFQDSRMKIKAQVYFSFKEKTQSL